MLETMGMTETEIVKILSKRTDERRFPWQLANSFIYNWECDFFTMTASGITREFEIKISRSDYFCDAKKSKHDKNDGANFFYYVCPSDLIKPDEVDKRYGLIYVSEESITVVKKPRKLNDTKFDKWELLANKMYWKFRSLWREKYIGKEISHQEYWEGFNISIEEFDSAPPVTQSRDNKNTKE